MINPRYKKLELSWFNKDKVLVWDENKKDYVWVEPDDLRASESRILIEKEVIGEPNSIFNSETKRWEKTKKPLPREEQNLLIKGDNLLALKSLEDSFAERIKLIYIDPPFNTGARINAAGGEVGYEDGLEHSIWLSMMKSRLEILKNLLGKDGVIFVHIDDIEQAYLKVIMDEVFGRRNFLAQIAWERSPGAGIGQGGQFVVNVTEYILAYAKNKEDFSKILDTYEHEIELKTLKQYKEILISEGKKKLVEKFAAPATGLPVKVYKHSGYKINTISLAKFDERKDSILNQIKQNFQHTFSTNAPQKENIFKVKLISKMDEGLYTVEYVRSRGKYAGQQVREYYIRRRLIGWLSEVARVSNNLILKRDKINDFWTKEQLSSAGISVEGAVEFERGKKPEQLLKRIIEISTEPNDWILDSFAGSGTTGAVAHKMGRRWIMIELGPHAETHCLKRLRSVVDGSDQTGISKEIGWKGGGGFRYSVLGKSLFKRDDSGIVEISYDNGPLIEAICKIEGFKFIGREFLNKTKLHGVVNEKRFCHITEEFVTQDYVDDLAREIKEDESLVIYCMKKISRLTLPDNIQVNKIPRDIVKKFRLE